MLHRFFATRGAYGYARGHRWLELGCMGALVLQIVWVSRTLVRGTNSGWQGLALLGMFGCGYLLADFFSGLAHWAGDTLGNESTPVFGRAIIEPFRHHHVKPRQLLEHDFVETAGNSCITAVVLLTPILLLLSPKPGFTFYACAALTSSLLWILVTNHVHKWAHAEECPAVIRWLQKAGVLLSPEHHAAHHREPYDRNYCITHGLMNPLLDRIGFFRRLERLVGRLAPRLLHSHASPTARRPTSVLDRGSDGRGVTDDLQS